MYAARAVPARTITLRARARPSTARSLARWTGMTLRDTLCSPMLDQATEGGGRGGADLVPDTPDARCTACRGTPACWTCTAWKSRTVARSGALLFRPGLSQFLLVATTHVDSAILVKVPSTDSPRQPYDVWWAGKRGRFGESRKSNNGCDGLCSPSDPRRRLPRR